MGRNKKDQHLNCAICGKPATHSIVLEVREKPGPPAATKVLHLVCEEHTKEKTIEYWVSGAKDWLSIVEQLKKKGLHILKQWSNINIEKLNK